jgi:hypothetical protein
MERKCLRRLGISPERGRPVINRTGLSQAAPPAPPRSSQNRSAPVRDADSSAGGCRAGRRTGRPPPRQEEQRNPGSITPEFSWFPAVSLADSATRNCGKRCQGTGTHADESRKRVSRCRADTQRNIPRIVCRLVLLSNTNGASRYQQGKGSTRVGG